MIDTKSAAIRRAVSLVQTAYPSGSGDWAKKRFEAWVVAVEDLDPDHVFEAARALVREWTDDYGRPPQPGHLRERALARGRASKPARSGPTQRWIDESALRDALAFLQTCDSPDDVAYAEEQIRAIRLRLPDRGAAAEEGQAVHYTRSPAKAYDPPGTIRYRVTQVGGGRPWPEDEDWPTGPRNGA